MDMVMNVDFVPVGGQTVIDKGTYTYVPGGKGANSAVAFSRLGAKCVFLTKLGKDANGDALLNLYTNEGMDVSYIKRDESVAQDSARTPPPSSPNERAGHSQRNGNHRKGLKF